jgi:NAD-dependent deacetylase
MEMHERISLATALLREARYPIALTGAGISTPSGIPDFRSEGSGLWERVDSTQVASFSGFRSRPDAFYRWIRPMVQMVTSASPNAAHRAIAEMEKNGRLRAVITQNIDNLHTRAGSHRVIELHGHFRTATCIRCYQSVGGTIVIDFLQNQEGVPICPGCGGVLKPDIVLMGEQLPYAAAQAALSEARRCDVMLIAGTSLLVEPAASLPVLAQKCGARLILVNLQPTEMDQVADVVVNEDVAVVLPLLAASVSRVQ